MVTSGEKGFSSPVFHPDSGGLDISCLLFYWSVERVPHWLVGWHILKHLPDESVLDQRIS